MFAAYRHDTNADGVVSNQDRSAIYFMDADGRICGNYCQRA